MADCSKTIEYGKEYARLCKSIRSCPSCPLSMRNNNDDGSCGHITQKRIDALQKWSDEHPVKTRKTVFLEIFPDAELKQNGTPYIYPCKLFTTKKIDGGCKSLLGSIQCEKCAEDYWNEEVMENDDNC